MGRDLYKIGDYVRFLGYGMSSSYSSYGSEIAKIIELKKHEDYWWVGVELLKSKERISFDVSKLRVIPLEEKHLLNLGFQKFPSETDFKAYKLNDIYVSSISLNIMPINFWFISGFCQVNSDLFNKIVVEELVENGEFNIKKFYDLYPNLYNLNDLVDILKVRSLITENDIEKLVEL